MRTVNLPVSIKFDNRGFHQWKETNVALFSSGCSIIKKSPYALFLPFHIQNRHYQLYQQENKRVVLSFDVCHHQNHTLTASVMLPQTTWSCSYVSEINVKENAARSRFHSFS